MATAKSATKSTQVWYHSVIVRYPLLSDPTPVPTEQHIRDAVILVEKAAGSALTDWVAQVERGKKTHRFHVQMYIHATDKVRASTLNKRLLKLLQGSPFESSDAKPASEVGKAALRDYCMKEDTRIVGPLGKRPIYTGRDLRCMDTLLPWQQQLYDMLEIEPDDRTLVWIHNDAGNVGKSKFMKWYRFRKKGVRVPMGTATQLKECVIAKGAHRCYLVDLPRVRGKEERLTEIFSALEEIKNGWVESAMHGKPKELMMEPPHVVVFSNQMPNLNLASRDRWRVFTVVGRTSHLSQNTL